MADSPSSILSILDLPQTLKDRIISRSPAGGDHNHTNNSNSNCSRSFVLYLPTVVLRHRHNPAFSLACRLANHYNVPLLVLCTVLDDTHLTRKPLNREGGICMTARRLTFYLQALQSCCPAWQEHGAGVAIRVHGPNGARTPHHLTLIHQHAAAVVLDEAFVEPFATYNRNIVKTCSSSARVPCWSVDGSTTVPPACVLKLVQDCSTGETRWTGVPDKAWKWEQKTNPKRKSHVYGSVRQGHLDAPSLQNSLPCDFFLLSKEAVREKTGTAATTTTSTTTSLAQFIQSKLPSNWINPETPCPGTRPWTVHELVSLPNIIQWVNAWPGTDTTVPACTQTHGSLDAAQKRWHHFYQHHLPNYASKRNQIVLPHAVSRMSCYWNLGIISIFDVVHDVWQMKKDCDKFLQELVKWREMSYAHCFALQPQSYHREETAIPPWALKYLVTVRRSFSSATPALTFEQLDSASTHDETWNAMQSYLIETGELHNNARMTWGKTALHWLAPAGNDVLWQMCCLNDRYALDGLSPPSYAGLLWCFGWCDKPANNGSISSKWAHRYRTGPDGFEQAKRLLLEEEYSTSTTPGKRVASSNGNSASRKRARLSGAAVGSKTLFSYFSPAELKK